MISRIDTNMLPNHFPSIDPSLTFAMHFLNPVAQALSVETALALDIGYWFQILSRYWILDFEGFWILDIEPQPTNPISRAVT